MGCGVSGISSSVTNCNNKSCHIYISNMLRAETFRSSSCRFDSCSHLRVHSYGQLPPQCQYVVAYLHVLHRGHVLAISANGVATLCLL